MGGHESAARTNTFPSGMWERATACGPDGGNCVEVNLGVRDIAAVRDGKRAAGPALIFSGTGWRAFLGSARSGRYDGADQLSHSAVRVTRQNAR